VHAGRPAHPQERVHVESIARFVQRELANRLPPATGSKPSDPRRQDSEKQAKRYHVSWDHIEELTEVVVAAYNATPHDDLNGDTPLECLERWTQHPDTQLRLLPGDRHSGTCVLPLRIQRTVTGSVADARRPAIRWLGVRYSNATLKRSFHLVKKKITIWIDTDDLRKVRAFLPDGLELGILDAAGAWGWVPHDLRMRTLLLSLRRRKKIHFSDSQDWRPAYAKYCAKLALKNKRVAGEYTRAIRKGFLSEQANAQTIKPSGEPDAKAVATDPLDIEPINENPLIENYVKDLGITKTCIL
jgi:putative transposase